LIGYLYEIEEIFYELFYHVKGKLLLVFLEIRHCQHNIFLLYVAYVEEWVCVAVSFFPLSSVGGMETLRMTSADDTSTQERELLLASLATLSSRDIRWEQAKELSLAQLMAVNIGYCWKEFGENEWVFVLA